jgi:hypothetical protein
MRELNGEDPKRHLAPLGSISNPVICITAGTSLLFDVNSGTGSYPQYLSSSILNTNKNFDYGQFLTLATQISGGATIDQFIFQFNTKGIYVFQNSLDNTQQMVLGVMGSGEKCPDSSSYINPTTLAALLLLGVAEDDDIVYEPDWLFIIGLCVGIGILCMIAIGVFYYFVKKKFGLRYKPKIKYRKVHLKGDKLPSIRADNACFEFMQKNKDTRLDKRFSQKMNRDIRYSEIEDIRQRLKNHIDRLKGDLFGGIGDDDYTGDVALNIHDNKSRFNILLELQKLKDLINAHRK